MFSPLQPSHAMTVSPLISHIPRNSSSSQCGNNSFRTDLVRFVCLYEFVPGIFFVPPESIRLGTAELIRRGIDSEGDRFHINAIRVNIGNCIWGESCFLPELIRRGSDSPQPNPYKQALILYTSPCYALLNVSSILDFFKGRRVVKESFTPCSILFHCSALRAFCKSSRSALRFTLRDRLQINPNQATD